MQNGTIPIGDLVEPRVEQTGPRGQEFAYVDIGSVDRETKRIVDSKVLPTSKAPSRARQVLKAGDVLVSMTRPNLNAVALVPPDLEGAIGSTGFHVMRPREAEPGFLFYAVQSRDFINAMCQKVQGALYPAVRPRDISSFCLPNFSLDAQRAIVAEIEKQFTRLEAGVSALRRVQANLKRYRAAVLKAACEGRLVVTEAKLGKAEHRGFESGEELLARILIERRHIFERAQSSASRKKKYKETAAAKIPMGEQMPTGWTWATWNQVGFAQNGRPFPSGEYHATGIKLIRPGNLHVSGKVIWTDENTRCLPQKFADANPDLIVRDGELVMNLTAQSLKDEFLGRVCVTGRDGECLLNQRLARLTPVIVLPRFALYLLKSWRFRRYVDTLNSGSLIQHMFTSQLAEFTFPLPPFAEQRRIVAEVDRRFSVAAKIEATISSALRRTTGLRDSVLQNSFE